MKRVLITGAAGFIGSHLCDVLLERECKVLAYDCLLPQVHGPGFKWPEYMSPEKPHRDLQIWTSDVRNGAELASALAGFRPDTVIHLAAMVGVAQSNHQLTAYTSCNLTGTAQLLEVISLLNSEDDLGVERVFIAGSMSSYGEGAYNVSFRKGLDGPVTMAHCRGGARTSDTIEYDWAPPRADKPYPYVAGELNRPLGLDESEHFYPASVYAWTKAEQERIGLLFGKLRGLDVRVGRFFNCYGQRQSLSNPYTGVAAIFAGRVITGQGPLVYEDGLQSRDFIHVSDVVSGIIAILEKGEAGEAYNVGTGEATTILHLAERIVEGLGGPQKPHVTGQVRAGDTRHCFADSSKLRALGWEPKVSFDEGIVDYVNWLRDAPADPRQAVGLGNNIAHQQLEQHGLVK